MFGQRFFENTAFLFTKWSYAKKDVNNRKKNNDSEDKKHNQFNKNIREAGIYDSHLLNSFFIDNSLNDNQTFEDSTEDE
jgi:hypothetical protein